MLGISMFLPFLPLYLRQLGVPETNLREMSGLIFAASFFAGTVATPVWGFLGDRHGRKLMVVRAALGLTVAAALMGLAQTVSQLFILRVGQGAISGFIAGRFGIRSVFFVSASVFVVILLLLFPAIREPERLEAAVPAARSPAT